MKEEGYDHEVHNEYLEIIFLFTYVLATFQAVMNDILKRLLRKCVLELFMVFKYTTLIGKLI